MAKVEYKNEVVVAGTVAKVNVPKSGKVAWLTIEYDEDGHKIGGTAFEEDLIKAAKKLDEGDDIKITGRVCYSKNKDGGYDTIIRIESIA